MSGSRRFHYRRWRFRFRLRKHGFKCSWVQHARKLTSASSQHLCKTSLSCAVEVWIDNQPEGFATERKNFTLASTTGKIVTYIVATRFVYIKTFATGCSRTQKAESLYHTRRPLEYVRNCLAWDPGRCYACLLRSRLQLRESEIRWIRYEQINIKS